MIGDVNGRAERVIEGCGVVVADDSRLRRLQLKLDFDRSLPTPRLFALVGMRTFSRVNV